MVIFLNLLSTPCIRTPPANQLHISCPHTCWPATHIPPLLTCYTHTFCTPPGDLLPTSCLHTTCRPGTHILSVHHLLTCYTHPVCTPPADQLHKPCLHTNSWPATPILSAHHLLTSYTNPVCTVYTTCWSATHILSVQCTLPADQLHTTCQHTTCWPVTQIQSAHHLLNCYTHTVRVSTPPADLLHTSNRSDLLSTPLVHTPPLLTQTTFPATIDTRENIRANLRPAVGIHNPPPPLYPLVFSSSFCSRCKYQYSSPDLSVPICPPVLSGLKWSSSLLSPYLSSRPFSSYIVLQTSQSYTLWKSVGWAPQKFSRQTPQACLPPRAKRHRHRWQRLPPLLPHGARG